MSVVGSAANEAARQAVRNAMGGEGQKREPTPEEADQELRRAENWRMVSAPAAFGGGWLAVSLAAGAPVAAAPAGVIFAGLAVASWLERQRARKARGGAVKGGAR